MEKAYVILKILLPVLLLGLLAGCALLGKSRVLDGGGMENIAAVYLDEVLNGDWAGGDGRYALRVTGEHLTLWADGAQALDTDFQFSSGFDNYDFDRRRDLTPQQTALTGGGTLEALFCESGGVYLVLSLENATEQTVAFVKATTEPEPEPEPEPEVLTADPEGVWIQTQPLDGYPPIRVTVQDGELVFKSSDSTQRGVFALEDYYGKAAQLVFLDSDLACESFMLYTDTLDGETFPVLASTLFEYDGRGLIIWQEFVREVDLSRLPQGYASDFARQFNSGSGTDGYSS